MIDQDTLVRTVLAERVKVLGYIQSLVRQPDLAEDIFQDVCALAVQKCRLIDNEEHLHNWMRTTARYKAMNLIRNRTGKALSLDPDVMDLIDSQWVEEDNLDSVARAEALRHCLKMLSESHRELVMKRFVEEYDYEKLATEIQRSVGSLYVTFSRIYSALGKCISNRLRADAGGNLG